MNKMRTYKPTSPGLRGLSLVDKRSLWKGKPLSALCKRGKNHAGRNNRGVITSPHRGHGHKKILRMVDFYRKKDDMPAVVERIEYDPGRTGFIALIKYEDGERSYILCPDDLAVGSTIYSGASADILPGNALILENIPVGTTIHNIEMQPGRGAKIGRSAGSKVMLVGKENGFATLKLPSKEVRRVSIYCKATVGSVSNAEHMNERLSKAGQKFWRGIRPINRGIARNPVDHPNGGRTHGGKIFANVTGRVIKGKKTRVRTVAESKILTRRKRRTA